MLSLLAHREVLYHPVPQFPFSAGDGGITNLLGLWTEPDEQRALLRGWGLWQLGHRREMGTGLLDTGIPLW